MRHLPLSDEGGELQCREVLRSLPGSRLVCRGHWLGRPVVAKIYQHPSRAEVHWRRERDGIRALHTSGLRTARLLFDGQVEKTGWWVLILEEIGHSNSMKAAWEEADEVGRRSLLEELVDLLAEHHNRGICQQDLHFGNFLITDEALYTLDGADIRVYPDGIPPNEAMRNLALLFGQIFPRYDEWADPLLQRYTRARNWAEQPDRKLFLRQIREQRDTRLQEHLGKLYRDCSAFICRRSRGRLSVLSRRYDTPAMEQLLQDPDASYSHESQLLKKGNTCTVWSARVDDNALAVKRYNVKGVLHGAKLSLSRGRAFASWENAHRLRIYGIATPAPVALIRIQRGRFRPVAYYISELVNGVYALYWFQDDSVDWAEKELMAKKIIELFDQLDAQRLTHGDMKATNILIVGGEPLLIDLDSMRQHANDGDFSRQRRRDRERFLRNWQDEPRLFELFGGLMTENK